MRRFRPLFDYDDGTIHADDAGHGFVCGRSGMGKTQWAIAFLEAKLAKPHWSIALVDPEGDISPRLLEYLAHPRCPFPRKVHYLRPASDQSFALPVSSSAIAIRRPVMRRPSAPSVSSPRRVASTTGNSGRD